MYQQRKLKLKPLTLQVETCGITKFDVVLELQNTAYPSPSQHALNPFTAPQ